MRACAFRFRARRVTLACAIAGVTSGSAAERGPESHGRFHGDRLISCSEIATSRNLIDVNSSIPARSLGGQMSEDVRDRFKVPSR